MKKYAVILLAVTAVFLLAVGVSAGTVMYQDGGANNNFVNGANGALGIECKFDEPFNVDDADCLYIRYYIENPDLYSMNGQIEITSSGTCDNQEFSWNLNNMEMEAGWNEWCIDLWTGTETGGMPDFEKINYFRIYFFTDDENLVALDYVAYGGYDEDFSSIATELGEVKRVEHVASDKVDRHGEGSSGAINMQATMELSQVDATNYTYAFIRFYVEGVDHFTGDGQLELTSKLACDQQEIHWNVAALGLQDGWNELMLDLDLPDQFDASFDRSKINYFRLYQFTEGDLIFDLDYIGFGNDGDEFSETGLPVYLVKAASLEAAEAAAAEAEDAAAAEAEAAAAAEAEAAAAAEAEAAAQAAAEAEAAAAAEAEAAAQAAAEAEAAAEEITVEEPEVVEAAEETVEAAPAEEAAPQTFDFAVLAAIASVVSLMGFAAGRKRS